MSEKLTSFLPKPDSTSAVGAARPLDTGEQAADVQKDLWGAVQIPRLGEAVRSGKMERLLSTETPGSFTWRSLVYAASGCLPSPSPSPTFGPCSVFALRKSVT